MLVISIPASRHRVGDDGWAGGGGGATGSRRSSARVSLVETALARTRPFTSSGNGSSRPCQALAHSAPTHRGVVRDIYQKYADEFPLEAREGATRPASGAYPIHPELFDQLFEEWSTLERFQRTRGVLRLMAAMIHELWARDDAGLLIMPASTPIDAPAVQAELTRYLEDGCGGRVALLGYGSGVGKALEAAQLLAGEGIDATVADAMFAKPLDSGLLAQLCAEHDLLVTVEEGVLAGGFGSAVLEWVSDSAGATPRVLRVGVPDHFVTHGAPALLHEEIGFTGRAIAERILAAISASSALTGA